MHYLSCIVKRSRISLVLCVTACLASLSVLSSSPAHGEPPLLLRFVEGVDSAPKPMTDSEVAAQLNDPWATLILRRGIFPPSIEQALAALNQLNSTDGGVPAQKSYFVSESGHIPVDASSSALRREFRMVITRGGAMTSQPSILISAPAGQRADFIELMSWDLSKRAFNFYHHPKDGEWTWKGDTHDAVQPATHLQGCFACHRNGVPVMKELQRPWNNWHSMASSIPPESIPDEIIRQNPLFLNKSGAEQLEPVVRGWIAEATATRIADALQGGTVTEAPTLLRPLFETTTVNLTSSLQTSQRRTPTLNLPSRFFLNFDVLSTVLGLNIPLDFTTVVQRTLYTNTLIKFAFRLEDGAFVRKGDTHFAFFVPEPAQEDVAAIRQLLDQQVITQRFAICIMMVDFPNPIFSAARSQLLQYVPATGHIQDGRSDLAERSAQAIVQAAQTQPVESPERQFAVLWTLSPNQLRKEAEKRLKRYLDAVQKRLKTQAGLDDYTRLAEARRQQFATMSALNEFPLLLPKTNLPPTVLQMHAYGTLSP